MTAVGCCSVDQSLHPLNDRQRMARTTVGITSLALAALATRRAGVLGSLGAAGATWFGASHLVAASTRYAGCPELGAIPSVLLHRDTCGSAASRGKSSTGGSD